MEFWQTLILGIVEGLTEFLPVSSTGHLIVVSDWMGIEQNQMSTSFSIIIQFAAILAVLTSYKSKIDLEHVEMWKKVAVSFLPIGIIGFIFSDHIKDLFTTSVVATMFIVGGVIFLIVEHFYKEDASHTTTLEEVSYRQAIWIGIAQLFALIPGTSRAGSTIIGGLLLGLDRRTSAEYSFLLALPVMAAVSGYELLKHYDEFSGADFMTLGIGFVVSFIVAWLTMKLLLKFLDNFTFRVFGVYRILFGVLLFAIGV